MTGQNQWQSPAVSASAITATAATAGSGSTVGPEAAQLARSASLRSQRPARLAAAAEEQRWRLFRKKRFSFLGRLHRAAQERAHSLHSPGQPAPGKPARKPPPLKLSVKREQLVLDSVRQLQRLDASELLRKLQVVFEGERGIDSGGLAKEWFIQMSQGLLAPELCLFRRNPDSGTYAVDPRAALLHAGEAAAYLRAFGRVCGKALFDQQLIEAPLCSALLRQMQGLKPGLDELAELDPSLAKSLRWLLDNDAAELLADGDLCFAVTVEEFGTHREVELLPGGAGRAVTAESKAEYVSLVVDWHLRGAVAPLLGPMLAGLWEVVPAQHLQGFSAPELAMLLNGRDEVDVDELRAGCVRYSGGYQEDSPPVALFWEVMASLPHERRAHVLRFITGCSKVPLDGYPPFLPFTITKSEYGKGALCNAHCCFNQLVLPPYETREELKAKLLMSCDHAEGFEMT
jgi:E3 ubiquitin-protein ligase HUWE1